MPKVDTKFACWVISLNREAENTRRLVRVLGRSELVRPEIFPAVDGRSGFPALEDGEALNVRKAWLFRNRQLSSGQVGCYLSHLRAVKKAYLDGYDRLCLIEDDVVIEQDFFEVLQEVLTLDEGYELVRLMGLRLRKRKSVLRLDTERYKLVRPVRGVAGTQAYVINRRGMEKLLKTAANIYEPIDIVYDHSFLYGIKVYGVEPHVVYELDSPSNISRPCIGKSKVPFPYRLTYPFAKVWLSIRRKWYYIVNFPDFIPADYPKTALGKTKRIR